MSASAHIQVIEDDSSIRSSLKYVLEEEGYRVSTFESVEAAESAGDAPGIHLLILDIMLPGESGFEYCRRLRAEDSRLPIMIVSALSEEASRVKGLDLGADDFISKPYSLDELIARVRALLRRSDSGLRRAASLSFGAVEVDFDRWLIEKDGQPVSIPLKAVQVLRYLSERPGHAISRDELLRSVWGYDEIPMTRTVDNQVALLRSQLETDPSNPRHIVTVHGVGYKFEP